MLLIAILTLTATASARKLYPIDEGAKDASFKAFRDMLIESREAAQHAICPECSSPEG